MTTHLYRVLTLGLAVTLLTSPALKSAEHTAKGASFTAYQAVPGFQLPQIVLQYDPATKSGANWEEVKATEEKSMTDPNIIGAAAHYLHDGLQRMTGKDFPIVSSNDLSKGIVLTLLKNASVDIQKDPEVKRALAEDPKAPYAAKEAFFLRSEKDRLLVVANTPGGLTAAVAELLESVDYEVLGMGVDWINVPNHQTTPLVFKINRAGRPSFYIRKLWAHSGQPYGYGTIIKGLTDPTDEYVPKSYIRWLIGTRMYSASMPDFPGHALQLYRKEILAKIFSAGLPEGFLAKIKIGPEAEKPAASEAMKEVTWVNNDPKGTPGFEKFYYCDGKTWKENAGFASVDASSDMVREIIFADMKKKSEAFFTTYPDELYIFPMDTEDGETSGKQRTETMAKKNWYPEYLAKEKLPFGRPYILNGYKGLNQPVEIWDASSESDTAYGLANYLLHEYDKWIDSLPKDQQVTSAGKSKKALIRASLQSYNYHDVPPNFNPDPRTRVAIAPFPKYRGKGKWEKLSNQEEMAKALHVMLPDEPSANYSFYSFSYYGDGGPGGIPAAWDGSAKATADTYHRYYDVGFRSITYEMDFNFGKYGLGYYLATKMLWNANLSVKDLDAIRNRWLQRSFGSAWKEMKVYYDFLLPGNYPVNSPNAWAKAIRLLDAADKKIATVAAKEPAAQKRIDDLKQIWYVHYLFDSGKYAKDAPEVMEYLWKGQMSYMVGMQGLTGRDYARKPVLDIVPAQIAAGPAHYTHAETQVWWPKILDYWQVTPVKLFAAATLANGKPAKNIDLNDLVTVNEFQMEPLDAGFFYNSSYMQNGTFLTTATQKDELIGFKLTWPYTPGSQDYDQKKVYYGAEIWDATKHVWTPWLDNTMTSQQSVEIKSGTAAYQLVDVQVKAPKAGVYRFWVGFGGNLSYLCSLGIDLQAGKYTKRTPFTYFTDLQGLTQPPTYVYIPKGTKSLDLDVWDTGGSKFVTLHTGLPSTGLKVSRDIDVGKMGVHSIALQPGEDGSFAMFHGNNFNFPFIYSVPTLWAKSPAALLVPRAIAQADGLTPVSTTPANTTGKQAR